MAVLTPLASLKTQNDRVVEEASCLVTYNSSNCVCDTKKISDTIPFTGLPNHTLTSIGRNLSQVALILTLEMTTRRQPSLMGHLYILPISVSNTCTSMCQNKKINSTPTPPTCTQYSNSQNLTPGSIFPPYRQHASTLPLSILSFTELTTTHIFPTQFTPTHSYYPTHIIPIMTGLQIIYTLY